MLAGILGRRAQSPPPPSVILKDRRRLQKREEEEVKGRTQEGLSSAGRSPQFATCVLGGRETAGEASFPLGRPCPCYSLKGANTLPLQPFSDRAEMGTGDADDYPLPK